MKKKVLRLIGFIGLVVFLGLSLSPEFIEGSKVEGAVLVKRVESIETGVYHIAGGIPKLPQKNGITSIEVIVTQGKIEITTVDKMTGNLTKAILGSDGNMERTMVEGSAIATFSATVLTPEATVMLIFYTMDITR